MTQIEKLLEIKPGSYKYAQLPVTRDLGGYDVHLPVHYIRGAEDGPTVTLLSTLHGNEWISIEIVRRVLERINPKELRGNILAVPVANPIALTQLTRNTPDDSDTPDMNRTFPGKATWASGLFARKLTEEIFPHTDYLIDYHTLCWGSAFGVIICQTDFDDPEVNQRTDELARAFGYPSIHAGSSSPGTSMDTAGSMGIPAIAVEIGGAGWGNEVEEKWLEENVKGTFNVFYHLGLVDGEATFPDRYLYWGNRWRLHPSVGGYLHSNTGPNDLLAEVEEGQELGRVLDTGSFEVLETIKSPARGLLYCIARSYPVRPGGWAYGVVGLDTLRVVEP